jgi:hypothetical protein
MTTKEQFEAFQRVRDSGLTNMFDVKAVIQLSGDLLDRESVLDIMKNYAKYTEDFGDSDD